MLRTDFRSTIFLLFLLACCYFFSHFCFSAESTSTEWRALLVGINEYAEPDFPNLRYSVSDVKLLERRLKEFGFKSVKTLTTGGGYTELPTKEKIEDCISELLESAGPNDSLFIMFSGHGYDSNGKSWFAPIGAKRNVPSRSIEINALMERMNKSRAKFKFLVVDACRNDVSSEGPGSKSGNFKLSELSPPDGMVALQSCSSDELSWEHPDYKHSLFSYYLDEALSGKADTDKDGKIMLTDVLKYVSEKTASAASELNAKQTPFYSMKISDFVFTSQARIDGLTPEELRNGQGLIAAAESKLESGGYDEALKLVDKALSLGDSGPTGETFKKWKRVRREIETQKRLFELTQAKIDGLTPSQLQAGLALVAQADEYGKNGEYSKALSKCNEALSLGPTGNTRKVWESARDSYKDKLGVPAVDGGSSSRAAGTLKTVTVNGVEFRLRWCPAGTFMMGSPETEKDRNDNETQHKVTLTRGFWMMETEVTQKQWESIMGNNPSYFSKSGGGSEKVKGLDTSNFPVEEVSWNDIAGPGGFIEKLNANSSGFKFRLPTEAEFEYAARSGQNYKYSGSDNIDGVAWYWDNSGRRTHEVGTKKANGWGLYDLSGNVWEWCSDRYDKNYYNGGSMTDPRGPNDGSGRVYRGGGWISNARNCRCAYRRCNGPEYRSLNLGFRLVSP